MKLGEIVKKVRKNKEYTQEELAEKTGLPLNTIHRYENDYADKIPPERLKIIATALNTTVSEIYSIKENPMLLNDPVQFYKGKSKSQVSITIQLDGSIETLNSWVSTLKKLNAAL